MPNFDSTARILLHRDDRWTSGSQANIHMSSVLPSAVDAGSFSGVWQTFRVHCIDSESQVSALSTTTITLQSEQFYTRLLDPDTYVHKSICAINITMPTGSRKSRKLSRIRYRDDSDSTRSIDGLGV